MHGANASISERDELFVAPDAFRRLHNLTSLTANAQSCYSLAHLQHEQSYQSSFTKSTPPASTGALPEHRKTHRDKLHPRIPTQRKFVRPRFRNLRESGNPPDKKRFILKSALAAFTTSACSAPPIGINSKFEASRARVQWGKSRQTTQNQICCLNYVKRICAIKRFH